MPDEPTLSELGRWIKDVQNTVHDLSDKLERGYVRASELAPLERRVSSLEGTLTWVVRLVVGAVLVALLGLVIVQSKGI